jgi:hypothetical protein
MHICADSLLAVPIHLPPCQVISATHSLTIPSDVWCGDIRLNGSIGSNDRSYHVRSNPRSVR